jgi:indole-3-glycerol phosphate synthase/phosphoribosylanthranilate isomerase
MLSLLGDAQARAMIEEARRLGMDCLVEVHDEREMRRAIGLGAPLIGINNRDLRDLSIDLATTERLARLAPDRLLVSESGISGRSDVDRLAGQVDGFLIGS